ncbi:MAG: hypothetical protein ACREA2_05370 [Blastocatellia bacterium]
MPSELEARLAAFFSREPATRVMSHSARWPDGFGSDMNEVRAIMAHVTDGWPRRERVEEFVTQFIGPPNDPAVRPNAGVGTQYFLAGDGTVLETIDMPSVTWHGNHTNNWAIGVETGNLRIIAPPQFPIPTLPKKDNRWRAMGPDPHLDADDIPGAKLWLSRHPHGEVIVSWWTTPTYNGPARQPVGNIPYMLFTEWQYRSWALLARYLCEQYDLPRNFPLLPYAFRFEQIDDSSVFRRITLADERFPVLVRALSGLGVIEAHFETFNQGHLETHYDAAIRPQNLTTRPRLARRNDIWTALVGGFRGIYGHGFSGSNTLNSQGEGTDHICPGPVFDWHRFAREVWDWWWYPFDLTDDLSTTVLTRRPYRRANRDTPLLEYYFEATDFGAKNREYIFRSLAPVGAMPQGIFDNISSPSVFRLNPETPVYAPANGELVAARFPLPDPQHPVSLAFVLLRHEIFHLPNTLTMEIDGVSMPAHPGRIDYDREPSYVYSLVMHLGRPEGMSFDQVTDANPDWLNRALMRKKECDLGITLYNTPNHGGIPQAEWNSRPPGPPAPLRRPTVIEGWQADQIEIQRFLNDLRAGVVAHASWSGRNPHASPIQVILGDFLGKSGVTRSEGGNVQHGIGLEVFSSGFVPPTFHSYSSSSGWVVPGGSVEPACLFYQSEWAKTPTAAERQRLAGIGVNPDLVPWWAQVALATTLDTRLPPQARLVQEGWGFHVRPLDFMRWINEVTWASEWPKYRVTAANGAEVPRPPRPRSRRV